MAKMTVSEALNELRIIGELCTHISETYTTEDKVVEAILPLRRYETLLVGLLNNMTVYEFVGTPVNQEQSL